MALIHICVLWLIGFKNFGFGEREEYCQFEIYQPQCPLSEVLVLTEAKYGRMRMGKCVRKEPIFETMVSDPQYLGCFTDVTDVLNEKCMGRNRCELKVSDPDIGKETPCYNNLKMYLEVDHKCFKVISESSSCVISMASDSPQHIIRTYQTNKKHSGTDISCGTKHKPWVVETLKGQQIKVQRMTFPLDDADPKPKNRGTENYKDCPNNEGNEGYITDTESKKKIALCGYPFAYTSVSNGLELHIESHLNATIFLKLETIGCSDLIPPADAWLKRTENEATMGCYSIRLRWQLKCIGQRWIGVIGNCSYAPDNVLLQFKPDDMSATDKTIEHSSQVLTLTVICAIGIILCSLIICGGIICLKWYNQKSKIVESVLKERTNMPNGSLLRTGDQTHYENEKKPQDFGIYNGIQSQYYVLDKDFASAKENVGL